MTQSETSSCSVRSKILLVDDDPRILAGLRRQLHRRYEVHTAEGGDQGLAMLADDESFAVVVSDMRMPGMDGAAFLSQVRSVSPQTTRILLTGQTELSAAIRAINDGQIFRFLNKPCPPDVLVRSLQEAVVRHEAAHHEYRLLTSVLGDRRVLESHGMYEALAVGLRVGLKNHEFRLNYQPILDLGNGRMEAVEALVRWAHPDGELVSAGSFLPAAETSGLIMPLGRWAMAAACQEVASWPMLAATETLGVHLNLSEGQVRDPRLVDDFAHTLILSGLEPGRVTLEIGISPVLQESTSIRSLNAIATWGVHIALGPVADVSFSSEECRAISFDTVKIGKHISALVPTDIDVRDVCHSIVETARSLKVRTIVEGIETADQHAICRTLGFDLAQGHLLGHPTEPGELLAQLVEGSP